MNRSPPEQADGEGHDVIERDDAVLLGSVRRPDGYFAAESLGCGCDRGDVTLIMVARAAARVSLTTLNVKSPS